MLNAVAKERERVCLVHVVHAMTRNEQSPHVSLFLFRYEPELHAAANFKIAATGANIKIYQNGAMAGTARNVQTLSEGIQEIYRNSYA